MFSLLGISSHIVHNLGRKQIFYLLAAFSLSKKTAGKQFLALTFAKKLNIILLGINSKRGGEYAKA